PEYRPEYRASYVMVVEPMAWQTDYSVMEEGMSILRGRKSVPRISSSERENGKKGTTRSSRELHNKELV
nr:hypothetical protein [Tanacetum cinerariifolium]